MLLFVVHGCRHGNIHPPAVSVPDLHRFDSFYYQFHTDSMFQLSNIIFPLEGKPEPMDTLPFLDTYYWSKENWLVHHLPDIRDSIYEQVFQVIDSTLLREIIFHIPSGYSMERRFSYTGDGWHLIYYAPMRRPVRVEIN
ncbi:MAG: hypothetical protein SH818_02045 [Saprospiraceae bacterium]|nr:hypothetical protein [Saprospiraceae bacterium]